MDTKRTQPEVTDKRLDLLRTDKAAPRSIDAGTPDNELVGRTRNGDLQAFEELFRRHQKRVYNIALRMLSNEAEAADVTQDVFVRVHCSIDKLNSDDAFATWVKITTMNRCRDILRRRGRLRIDSLDAPVSMDDGSTTTFEIPDTSNDPQDSLEKKFIKQSVHDAIASLSPDAREVITLFYVDGTDIAGICKILGSPEGTIKSRLSRARAELKRKLQHHIEN